MYWRTALNRRSGPLLLHLDAPPEGHAALDLARHGLGVRIVPSRVRVILPVDLHVQIAGLTLDGTEGGSAAGAKILALKAGFGKIDISLHRLRLLAFGKNLAVPDCSRHGNTGQIRFNSLSAHNRVQ